MNDATVNAILAVVFVAAGLACFPAVTDYSTDTCWLFVGVGAFNFVAFGYRTIRG
ncbi:hypothetical protein MBEHAL_1035 [Halarchaeum acidiphilum MH1-52-1]|uniref:Uncharacterized protein n=1 Tax=Halarchaeum acidiphilum MH1-52-1 TaxID=1261545 RepID=U2YTD7_9EURY|nr:hypothetical protein [Halarchaeum acidiphilum]GAD52275.1 hypothetical protein MBEHAL_1035 [Halarchaeum acidiphilum MH1-52-1]